MKPWLFYFGQLINVIGVVGYLVGISSDKWISVSWCGDAEEVSEVTRQRLVVNYGPWSACTMTGRCDHLWLVLGGIDMASTRLVQTLIAISALFYVVGLLVMIIQMFVPNTNLKRLWHNMLDNQITVEIIISAAAITGFVSMLTVGELKRRVILDRNQTGRADYGFYTTITAILLTIIGSVCMILNRYAENDSHMPSYIVKMSQATWLQRLLSSKKKPQWRIEVSQVTIGISEKFPQQNLGLQLDTCATRDDIVGTSGNKPINT